MAEEEEIESSLFFFVWLSPGASTIEGKYVSPTLLLVMLPILYKLIGHVSGFFFSRFIPWQPLDEWPPSLFFSP